MLRGCTPIKLQLSPIAVVMAIALGVGGCASRAVQPVAVATNTLTSADVGEKHAPTPKVGKAEHVGTAKHAAPSLTDEKTVTSKDGERRSYEVFGDWK